MWYRYYYFCPECHGEWTEDYDTELLEDCSCGNERIPPYDREEI